jgi:SIR2-like domain
MSVDLGLNPALGTIADAVQRGACILFLGAGVHAPAPTGSDFQYSDADRPPFGRELSKTLADSFGLHEHFPGEDEANLQRVALFYELVCSRRQLVEAVQNAVQTDKTPSPMLRALAQLDFPVIITTNYDQLLETALVQAGKQPRVAVYTPHMEATTDHRDPRPQSPVVFKIHGDVFRHETMVITDEDYIDFVLRMNSKEPYDPVPLTLKYYLTRFTTLFVGYRLVDYNLRLLFRTLRWKMDPAYVPDTYSVDHRPDPLIFDVWHNERRYVKFITEDVWAFVPKLYERVTGRELVP